MDLLALAPFEVSVMEVMAYGLQSYALRQLDRVIVECPVAGRCKRQTPTDKGQQFNRAAGRDV